MTLDHKAAFTIRDGLLDETGILQGESHHNFMKFGHFGTKCGILTITEVNMVNRYVSNQTQLITRDQSYSNIHNAIE